MSTSVICFERTSQISFFSVVNVPEQRFRGKPLFSSNKPDFRKTHFFVVAFLRHFLGSCIFVHTEGAKHGEKAQFAVCECERALR